MLLSLAAYPRSCYPLVMKVLIPFIPALMCVLWGLVCLRVYFMISKRFVWQRHLVAIAAGLGGGRWSTS